MNTKIKWLSLAIALLFMTTTLSGALDISARPPVESLQDSLDSTEVSLPPRDDPSTALLGIVYFRLAINPSFSAISGIGLPTQEGKHPLRFISNLQWQNTGAASVILYFNVLTLKFDTTVGSSTGNAMFYMGPVEINDHLIGATDYIFKGIAWSITIEQ